MILRDKNGFSLVEVMISLVILAFGILGTIGMFSASDKAIGTSYQMTRALRAAQEKLESKKGGKFESLLLDDLDGDGVLETPMTSDSTGNDKSSGDGIYAGSDTSLGILRRWTISLNGGMARIDVASSWTDKNGIGRSLALSTIKTDERNR
ncbi:MAG: prepilin-type N-terminal cleavage/methylation domain-containing protein [Nitrospirae bacterium]|nr:prepilin-type N-terminal cleavage/methylation domain-containing protein [Nitrospirota bacterium]